MGSPILNISTDGGAPWPMRRPTWLLGGDPHRSPRFRRCGSRAGARQGPSGVSPTRTSVRGLPVPWRDRPGRRIGCRRPSSGRNQQRSSIGAPGAKGPGRDRRLTPTLPPISGRQRPSSPTSNRRQNWSGPFLAIPISFAPICREDAAGVRSTRQLSGPSDGPHGGGAWR